jgi:hypothetical protein
MKWGDLMERTREVGTEGEYNEELRDTQRDKAVYCRAERAEKS